jgi:HEPN domain-containing protein
MIKKAFFIPLLALTLFTGVAHAQASESQAGIVPGNPLYILDIISEGIGTMFTFGDVAKAERYLTLASERLAEAQVLANNGKSDKATETVAKYEEKLAKAMAKVEQAKENGKDTDDLLTKIADATSKHQEVLAGVLEKVPEQAKEAIQNAMERSQKGHDTALEASGGTKETRAQNDNIPENPGSQGTSTRAERAQPASQKPENVGRPQQ